MQKRIMSKFTNTLVWLRNDLRVHDHPGLHWANENSEFVTPVFFLDPRVFEGTTHHCGFPKMGKFRRKFILESLEDLKKGLKSRGSDLIVMPGRPEDILPGLDFDAVVWQREVTKEETEVEKGVYALAKGKGAFVWKYWGSTLYHPDDLGFDVKSVPDTYTEFRKKVEGNRQIRKEQSMPQAFKGVKGQLDCCLSDVLKGEESWVADERTAFPFTGGETAGLSRLQFYLSSKLIESYKATRNGLIGPDYSTKFSSWLAFGCLSPRRIYWEIKKYEKEKVANESTYWVIFELLWRDYFRFVSGKYGDRIFYKRGIRKVSNIEWGRNKNKEDKWKDGLTGVPFVDGNMRELLLTGWMSNRGRQNVASFLVKDLGLDWRVGAEWFESLLIDYDVCSNYGNWNYSAGIGNDPREGRKFNVIKQGLDYDWEGSYIRLWIEELKSIKDGKVHMPWTLQLDKTKFPGLETYPKPIVIAKEWGNQFNRFKQSGTRDNRQANRQPQQRGIDFYFKSGPARQ